LKKLLIVWLFLLLAAPPSAQAAEPIRINSVTVLTDAAKRYEKIELSADISATFSNPYDPNDIRVDGRFVAPSGSVIIVPGFYYRDYTYDSGSGTVKPTANWSWRVRFTPTEVGTYQYQVLAHSASDDARSAVGTVEVAASDDPGFIRVDGRNPRYFAFDNGTPYFPIGEDMGWSNGTDPLADYDKWLGKLSAVGGNFVRVWMPPWGFDIEWLDTGLGNYDQRQGQAYQLDRLMDLLHKHHIYMMLSLLNHGQFSTTTNPEWDQNPFNSANGGPCDEPACFATNPTAIGYWNQRLRYIAARWGYSTQIMSWEWWNEINWTPLQQSSILAPWLAKSGAYLRSLDPYKHLITHDGSPVADQAVWTTDSIDFTQDHRYNMQNLLLSFKQIVPQWLDAYPSKPFLIGEFGDPLNIDNLGLFVHLGLWSGAMNGSAGSGMTWYWDDYVDRLDLYDQFSGIAAFFHDEDMAAHQWQATTAKFAKRGGAGVYGLQADDEALLWMVSSKYTNQTLSSQYNDAIRQAIRTRNANGVAYSFEDGAEGWTLDPAGVAGKSVTTSSDQATDGSAALAIQSNFSGSSSQEAIVSVPVKADWSAHTTVALDIYAPEGATDFGAQIFITTGTAQSETGSEHIALQPGQWNHIAVQLSPLGDLHDVRGLGVKIGTNFSVFDGVFYVDKIVFGDTPEVKFEFAPIDANTLTVTDLKPGDYVIQVWDTQTGTIVSSTQVESSDGTVSIDVPSFTSDLAIKVQGT
jgi:Domain of unknown function (DUF5060)/Mannanase, galactose-binding domain-like